MSFPANPKEFTVRGVLLGILITLVFTAAQIYLGLKVGLTFATSIPAAVISMALLQAFRSATIQENNIVQTIASAAGTLSSVIFVLPGLIIIGWWAHVPFFMTFAACAVGGILGVMYTMPLRRALVVQSNLPYPEGVAAAEVLKVGTSTREGAQEGKAGLWAILMGSLTSAFVAFTAAVKIIPAEVAGFWKVKAVNGQIGATSLLGGSSLALMGAGHLMGITVGIAMLTGLIIASGFALPYLTSITPMADGATIAQHAGAVFRTKVRLLGAGAIAVASLWTLGKLIVPVWLGLMSALESNAAVKRGDGEVPRTDRDLPVNTVGIIILACMVPVGWLLAHFIQESGTLQPLLIPLVGAGVAFALVAGLIAAAVCGYMAGLIGSSNSPVSGLAILAVLTASLMVGVLGRSLTGPDEQQALIAFILFLTTIVLAVAVVGNDNLQDLKTGQLVGATPWKQQVALIIGVIAGAIVIPPVLELLNQAYGFPDDPNRSAITAAPLNAPQATLIASLAKGVIGGNLDWELLGYGGIIGAVLIAVDIIVKKVSGGKMSLPPLGVSLAIYLPSAVTAPVVVGAVSGWIYEKTVSKRSWGAIAKRLGVLVASGFIVGESLFNVAHALLIVITQKETPLAFMAAVDEHLGTIIAFAMAVVIVVGLYVWSAGQAKKIDTQT
ncbi:oligopeptide transporter, OPT family [Asticcacaulis biprosthecium C19]|uniref:Oligopeptide transporter, OPT family n=1 Tax=Asticcacaulis biprosthecium C19 TaxID=715226 RepID=F4QSV8_9CAUL|nr:oligopeptide transporter, OPT family [Asticcacaulis biprosthecium]EGF89828.1 oligopeptide transporter, OPT family [Asticcacaulis biprosthecium C19]